MLTRQHGCSHDCNLIERRYNLREIPFRVISSIRYSLQEVIKMILPFLLTVFSLTGLISSSAASSAGSSPRVGNSFNDLQPLLSSAAEIYRPGSEGYINVTTRWSADTKPGLDVIVKVASEEDVQATVSSLRRPMLFEPLSRVPSNPQRAKLQTTDPPPG